ncbi:hypothetical protein [Nigerium massiliense]|uniref:hypothetical protein n=1 Tax=Nigerium massiliense TaxID=1522317 RepID=UPI000590430D|nr:hypothetical protein [Nigerium massiliense]
MGHKRWRRASAILIVGPAVSATVLAAGPASAADGFTIDSTVQVAPTGMAAEPDQSRYWVVGGTAGRLSVHAVDASGRSQGATRSTDQVRDPEALAFHDRRLYVGDIGGQRSEVDVWRLITPVPGTVISHAERLRYRYPDGSHRAAAMFVTPTGRIHVVTTGANPGIYAAPDQLNGAAVLALKRVASAPVGVTDATSLADGRVVVRTASAVSTLDSASFAVSARGALPKQSNGAALTTTLSGTELLAAPAASKGAVVSLAIPGGAPAPSDFVTPSAAPTPQGQPAGAPALFSLTSGVGMVLASAAAAALIAAVIVVARR